MTRWLTCDTRGCRAEDYLALCVSCQELVCPAHAVKAAGGVLCPACAPALPVSGPLHEVTKPEVGQPDLFSSVRPRAPHLRRGGARLMVEQK